MSLAYAPPRPQTFRTTWVPTEQPSYPPPRTPEGRSNPSVVKTATGAISLTSVMLASALIATEVTPASGTELPSAAKPLPRTEVTRPIQTMETTGHTTVPKLEGDDRKVQEHKSAPRHRVENASVPTVRTSAYFSQFAPADAAARRQNAALIIALGKHRGLSNHSIAIAIATSIQESGLRNLDWGDRDSLGLFQQRPSVLAWGTAKQILDRTHAINQFYDRLMRIPDRDKRSMIDVAIQIQIPNPQAYYSTWQWSGVAAKIVTSYS